MAKQFSVSAVIKAIDNVSVPMKKMGRNLDAFGSRARKLGGDLSLRLTAPIAGIGFAAVRGFTKFEDKMSAVSTLVDTSTESMSKMTKEIEDIGIRVRGVPLNSLAEALYDVRSAGIDSAESMNVLEQSAKLGLAGLGTTKESVDLVTSSINAFNLEGDEAEKVYDNIFKTVKSGKTNISQLSQGFGAVAGTVATAGVKLDEYLSSVAAMTSVGLPAAQAHTQIRAAISGLTRETEHTTALFDHLGAENFQDLIQKSGGMVNAFQRITKAVGGNDAALIKILGSTEAYAAVNSLASVTNETFTETLNGMRNEGDALDEAFTKRRQTLGSFLTFLANSAQMVGNAFFENMGPNLEVATAVIEKITNYFRNLSPEVKSTILIIAGSLAVLGPLIMIFGTLASAIGKIIILAGRLKLLFFKIAPIALKIGAAFKFLSSLIFAMATKAIGALIIGVKALFGLLLANPITAIIAGIIIGLGALYIYWDEVVAFMKNSWKSLTEFISDSFIGKAFSAASAGIKGLLGNNEISTTARVENEDMPNMDRNIRNDMSPRDLSGIMPVQSQQGRDAKARVEVDVKAPQGTRVRSSVEGDQEAMDMNVGQMFAGLAL